MPTFNSTATLNGTNPFALNFFGNFNWSGNFLRTMDLWDNDATNIHNVTLNLTGSNWTVRELTTGGSAQHNVVLTDQNANGGRFFELIQFYDGGSLTANLQSTGARSVFLRDGVFDLNLGGGFFGQIQLQNAVSNTLANGPGGQIQSLLINGPGTSHIDNDLDIGGRANQVRIWRGNNDIDVSGRIEALKIDEAASNSLTITAAGRVDQALINGVYDPVTDSFSQRSDNDINVQGRMDYLRVWAGDNTIQMGGAARIRTMVLDDSITSLTMASGGYVEQLSSSGDATITLLGSARIEDMRFFRGTQNVSTGSSWGDNYHSYLSTNTLNIGTGGLGSVSMNDAVGHQTVMAAGFVNSVRLTGNATATMTFNAGIAGLLAFGGTHYTINVGAGTDTGYNGTIQAFASQAATITTGAGEVVAIVTGGGNDLINTGTGRVYGIDAGGGNDRVNLGAGGADAVAGGDGNDTLVGSAGNDVLFGGMGSDSLRGGLGNDSLFGGDGNDVIRGEGGNNLIEGGLGRDTVIGGAGDETILGGGGNDSLVGGNGEDVIYGGSGDDYMLGNNDADQMFGGSGNDSLFGGAGADLLLGGDGNDSLRGGPGDDTMYGGAGNDVMRSDNGFVEMYGGAGNDSVYGGTNSDTVYGGSGDDLVAGDRGDDLVYGGFGNDRVFGNDDNDILYGGAGDDTMSGGNGNDILYGGIGSDVLTGGPGADVFVFDSVAESPEGVGRDRITDFSRVQGDKIDLRGLGQNLSFVASFTGVAGQVVYESALGRLLADLDGDGVAEFGVDLTGAPSIGAVDLIL